jgi:hypothetical protein
MLAAARYGQAAASSHAHQPPGFLIHRPRCVRAAAANEVPRLVPELDDKLSNR